MSELGYVFLIHIFLGFLNSGNNLLVSFPDVSQIVIFTWNLVHHKIFTQDNENIKFTAEIEKNKPIPFLYLLLSYTDDGSMNFKVYRKPTHNIPRLFPYTRRGSHA